MPALYTRFCWFHCQSSGHSVQFGLLPRRKHYHAFTMIALYFYLTFNKVATALCPFSPDFKLKVVPNTLTCMAWLCTIKGLAVFLFTSKKPSPFRYTCLSPPSKLRGYCKIVFLFNHTLVPSGSISSFMVSLAVTVTKDSELRLPA